MRESTIEASLWSNVQWSYPATQKAGENDVATYDSTTNATIKLTILKPPTLEN